MPVLRRAEEKTKRSCEKHSRTADSMLYQAKCQGGEALKLLKQTLDDDVVARQEVLSFAKLNPPDVQYARKETHRLVVVLANTSCHCELEADCDRKADDEARVQDTCTRDVGAGGT